MSKQIVKELEGNRDSLSSLGISVYYWVRKGCKRIREVKYPTTICLDVQKWECRDKDLENHPVNRSPGGLPLRSGAYCSPLSITFIQLISNSFPQSILVRSRRDCLSKRGELTGSEIGGWRKKLAWYAGEQELRVTDRVYTIHTWQEGRNYVEVEGKYLLRRFGRDVNAARGIKNELGRS